MFMHFQKQNTLHSYVHGCVVCLSSSICNEAHIKTHHYVCIHIILQIYLFLILVLFFCKLLTSSCEIDE